MSGSIDDSHGIAGGVIEPVSVANFFSTYWEQKPLHIARETHNPFAHLIDAGAIEVLLSTHSLVFPNVQLSRAGQIIPVEDYTDSNRYIINERLVQHHQAGCTIVISHAHKLHPPLMELCREVQAEWLMRCQTNVYLSPPGNQGFNPHHDTHDVFILQVSGRKTFSFYAGGAELPTSADRFDRQVHSVGDKTEEIELSAGDTLYIPRGFVHDAVADEDVSSLHITLGVYPILMHSLVNQLVDDAMQTDVRFRASVRELVQASGRAPKTLVDTVRKIVNESISEQSVADALSTLHDEAALDAKQNIKGQLSNSQLLELGESTALRVNRRAIILVDRAGDGIRLRTQGSVLEMQQPMAKAADWILSQSSLKLGEIPGLNADQQRALVEQLLAYNVLLRQ